MEAGIAERIVDLDGFASQVSRMLGVDEIKKRCHEADQALLEIRGNKRALDAIEESIEQHQNVNNISSKEMKGKAVCGDTTIPSTKPHIVISRAA